ncbi:hypothetical protein JOE58_003017 [Curtobacterium luteum]|uniref:Uncharacterized protein n=1 Tax=Curtobacterium luteum TaxID=33881 RepID=A0A8H9GBP8_9MICO|nr:hypothetical protein [Curtobacterium luteum]MBM7803766.1 hypothetical protein [Curtobacterium luteum]NUU51510.1 hypothetical protein [Curtobacterium luteum]GGL02692.1 hypothetical protein GCM10009769_20990 [Curtobacterium luteum]
MPKFRTTLAGITLSSALIAGSLLMAPSANAAETPRSAPIVVNVSATHPEITLELINQAIADARAAGAVTGEKVQSDGTRTVTIDAGNGFTLDLNETNPQQRLSAGSDSYGGVYVGFNSFDQNLIISGAAAGLTAGICVLGPAVCAVATIAITIATVAVSTSGGVRCGTKSLRVYPVSNKNPRCA